MVQIEGILASAIDDEDEDEGRGRFGRRCAFGFPAWPELAWSRRKHLINRSLHILYWLGAPLEALVPVGYPPVFEICPYLPKAEAWAFGFARQGSANPAHLLGIVALLNK
jgi:hypothetical protein